VVDLDLVNAEQSFAEMFANKESAPIITADEEHKDNIFAQQYIPRTVKELSLDEIYRMEKEGSNIEDFANLAVF